MSKFDSDTELWYALWTYHGEERKVFKALSDLGITAALPKDSHTLLQKGRVVTKERIIFSGYCFVRVASKQLRDLQSRIGLHGDQSEMEGIGGFLCDGESPAPIPYAELSPHIYLHVFDFLRTYDRSQFKSQRTKRREKAKAKYLANLIGA